MGRIRTTEKNYTEAIAEYKKATSWFKRISDAEHGVKVFYQIGAAYERSGHDIDIVIDYYRSGFEDAVRLVDNEQILKNGCALCRIYSEKKDVSRFKSYYGNVLKVAAALKNDQLIAELEGYKQKLSL